MRIYETPPVYTTVMTKHLVDIDDEALGAARATLGTQTIEETVNEALRAAAGERSAIVKETFDRLAVPSWLAAGAAFQGL
jgi:Arc/MetJ family transcription regulator